MNKPLNDGVYFGLSDEQYHSQERLSCSGIKNLLVSPMDFWIRSWLNPRRKEDDDEPEWALKGRAYHKRICEGKGAFDRAYAKQIEPQDVPGSLVTQAQLKAECLRLGVPVSGTKDVLSDRLRQFGCQNIWDDIESAYIRNHVGQSLIPGDWLYDIELAAACVEKHPTLSKCFQGGYAEIAVLWTAEVETNNGSGEFIQIPMKAKFDYWKPQAIVDLKSFANKMRKPIDRAVYYDIAANKYHIQTAVYYGADDAARRLIGEGKVFAASGGIPPGHILDKYAANEKTFVFTHQQKGIAPVAVGNTMPRSLGIVSVGQAQVREAQQTFHDCLKIFGALPWIMDRPLQQIADTDIPMFASE